MQASGGNRIPFSAYSLWPYYYHSIDKLNPRLICIASLYNLLFIHCFSLPYILLNLIIPFSVQQPPQTVKTRVMPCFPVRASQWKRKSEMKICHWVINSIVFISEPILQSFSIILIDFVYVSDNCYAIKALVCLCTVIKSSTSRHFFYHNNIQWYYNTVSGDQLRNCQ